MAYLNSGSGPGGLLSDQPELTTPVQEPVKGSINPNFGSNFSLGVGLTPIQSLNLGANPTPATTPTTQQSGALEAKAAFDNAAKRYDTGPMDVVDLADVNTNRRFGLFGKRTDVQGLISRGFNYLDNNGLIVQVKPGTMSEEDFLTLAENARNNQSLAQKYGMGNMNGWTKDAIEFRRRLYQGSNPYMTFDPTKPTQSTIPTTEGTPGKKSYNWDISFDKEGDFSWDDISTRLIKAMYANGKYDVLDQMLDNGKITDNGLSAFYQTTLGLTPGENGKIRFNKDALQAALNGQYITQAQFDEMSGLLPQELAAAKTQPAASAADPPAVAPKDDAYWLAQAKKYGFENLDAVKLFQQENGLLVDGKVGNLTIAALNALKSVNNGGTPSNFRKSMEYYGRASKNPYSYNIKSGINARKNQFSMTPQGGMHFGNTGYTWYDNGRVYDSKNKRKGTYTTDNEGRFDIKGIKWDKKGGKLMKYFQAGGAVNQQQVAQEKSLEMQQIIAELLEGIAHSDPNAIKRFAYRLGIDEQTATKYATQILKEKQNSANSKKDNDYQLVQGATQGASDMAKIAKKGSKLEYIQKLRGVCPEGYELKMFKAGGKVCKKCQKVEEACKGKKMEEGGESPIVQQFKNGRKCKK